MNRLLDIFFATAGLLLFAPVMLVIATIIPFGSRGGILFRQTRVGRNGRDFTLLKFRTMERNAERRGGLTIGADDIRITLAGRYLRKYKLDELPQLFNVIKGDMSLVGPRPEIRRYVELYTAEQRRVLEVRPGITDWASIEYINENEMLGASEQPEETYIREVMPAKIRLNMRFIEQPTPGNYLKILLKTSARIFSQNSAHLTR